MHLMTVPHRLSCLLLLLAVLTGGGAAHAQSAVSPHPRAGAELGAYFAGEEFTQGLQQRSAYPMGSVFFEMPIFGNLGLNTSIIAGSSRNLVSNIRDLKEKDLPYSKFSYNTTYAGVIVAPALFLPELVGSLGTTLYLRGGFLSKKTLTYRDNALRNDDWKSFLTFGAGLAFEYPLSENLSLRATAMGNLTNSDLLDGYALGEHNDGFSTFGLGFSWRFKDSEQIIVTPSDYFSQRFSDTQLPPVRSTLASSSVRVKQFSSLDELRKDPSLMMLYLTREGAGKLPMQVQTEILHGGRRIGWSNRVVTVTGDSKYTVLHAGQFVDMENLALAEEYRGQLPSGKYDVQVTVVPASQGLSFNARSTFQTINLDEFFGDDKAGIEAMLEQNMATITTTDDNQLVISMFDAPAGGEGASPATGEGGRAGRLTGANDGLAPEGAPEGWPARASALPPQRTLTETEWETGVIDSSAVMAEEIRRRDEARSVVRLVDDAEAAPVEALAQRTTQAFTNAVSVMHSLKTKPNVRKAAVIAVVYFPMNESVIGDEGRITLDFVARQVRAHPNLRLELRGYALEYNDRVLNERLSEQRTQRVYDYLVRRIVPTSLIRDMQFNALDRSEALPEAQPKLRKVEIALVEDEDAGGQQPPLMFERETD